MAAEDFKEIIDTLMVMGFEPQDIVGKERLEADLSGLGFVDIKFKDPNFSLTGFLNEDRSMLSITTDEFEVSFWVSEAEEVRTIVKSFSSVDHL